MITLIIKKQICKDWLSFTGVVDCRFKTTARFWEWYYTKKGYEVEELNDIIKTKNKEGKC